MPTPFDPNDLFNNEFASGPTDNGNDFTESPLTEQSSRASGALSSSFYRDYKRSNERKSNTANIRSLNTSIQNLNSQVGKLTKEQLSDFIDQDF